MRANNQNNQQVPEIKSVKQSVPAYSHFSHLPYFWQQKARHKDGLSGLH
jgi:hypothetical protein